MPSLILLRLEPVQPPAAYKSIYDLCGLDSFWVVTLGGACCYQMEPGHPLEWLLQTEGKSTLTQAIQRAGLAGIKHGCLAICRERSYCVINRTQVTDFLNRGSFEYLFDLLDVPFFFLRLPTGQYGPVSQLSRSEESCTGPFNWGEAHCAGEKVKRKIGPFQWKSL